MGQSSRVLKTCPLWMILTVAAGALVFFPAARACSLDYLIWAIRDKAADPSFRFTRNGKMGYIDSTGKILIQPTLPSESGNTFGEFHEGLLAVSQDHGYRYIDRSGKVVFRADVVGAFNFSEGLAPAAVLDGRLKSGFLDRTGRFAIPPEYFGADEFSEGVAGVVVSRDFGSKGYIDTSGKLVIPARFSYSSSFHEGVAAVIMDGPCQVVNGGSCGSDEFRPTRSPATYSCRYAYINKSGSPISDLRFDGARDFSEGFAPVRIEKKWGYLNKAGEINIAPQFDAAEPFSEGVAAVAQNGKTGFIDHSGKFVIVPQFQYADAFSDGRAVVSEDVGGIQGGFRFIDKTGKPAFPGTFAAAASFSHGLAPVAYGKHVGSFTSFAWINASGKPVFTYPAR